MRSRQRNFLVWMYTWAAACAFSAAGGGPRVGGDHAGAGQLFAQQPAATSDLAARPIVATRRAAAALPPAEQPRAFAKLALGQAAAGDPSSAAKTIAAIEDSGVRAAAIDQLRQAAGGGAMADFTTLMNLIQTTVAPDTWEELGGPSSMFPYPGGIYVDSQGLLHETVRERSGDRLEDLRQMLRPLDELASPASQPNAAEPGGLVSKTEHGNRAPDADDDWKRPARLRCVSLRRLADAIVREQARGRRSFVSWPDPMRHLAGLSEIRFILFDPESQDVILAGTFGGIDRGDGWTRDRASGHVVMTLSALTTALHAAKNRQPFGCSIDPTEQAIADSLAVAEQIRRDVIPLHDAADAMRKALGRQRVRFFGTSGDQPLGWLLVEADRHMKQLALGEKAMPEGMPNYLDAIDRHIASGVPDQQLLRLWFTGVPMSVRSGPQQLAFELTGTPLRLARENQIPNRFGGRRNARPDVRLSEFVESFNKNLPALSDRYPLYSALASVYRAAAVAELIHRHAESETSEDLCGRLADASGRAGTGFPVPREVESIAVRHSVQQGRRRHQILIASGGVWVEPQSTLARSLDIYPPLEHIRPAATDRPMAADRWWWNVR